MSHLSAGRLGPFRRAAKKSCPARPGPSNFYLVRPGPARGNFLSPLLPGPITGSKSKKKKVHEFTACFFVLSLARAHFLCPPGPARTKIFQPGPARAIFFLPGLARPEIFLHARCPFGQPARQPAMVLTFLMNKLLAFDFF